MDNKNVQRNLFAALLQNELKSNVEHFTTYVQTCLAANEVAAGCENLLQKLESTFTFCNKICTCCAFYHRPPWNRCPATIQVVGGCENLLQKVESSCTFCNKICTCCASIGPRQTLFCCKWRNSLVWRDSRVILSNQKSVLSRQLATTWFVARQVWTWVVKRATSQFNSFRSICKTN